MYHKHKIQLIIILASIMAFCLVLSSCFLHQHEFDKWDSDNDSHWQVCGCGEQIGEKNSHNVTSWTTDVEATETTAGSRHGTCSECNRSVTEVIPRLEPHVHTPGEDYECTSYAHFKRCTTCKQAVEIESHKVDAWVIDKEASANETGYKHGECAICKYTVETTIPALDHVHTFTEYDYDDDFHWNVCSSCEEVDADSIAIHNKKWIVDTPATTTSVGIGHYECQLCDKQFPSETIPQLTGGARTVDLYAINDFHGATDKISTVGGFLKGRKNSDPNTILINSGDMFQGSMESNSNYGKLLTDCMEAITFDAFTFGNHEFDWGLDNLKKLANNSSVPFLGANIYHWNAANKTWGTFASEFAKEYVVKTLDNGLKVGIIGIIGENQITSICSNLVQTIGFKDPLPIVKSLSAKLRAEEGCDVVVVSVHAASDSLNGNELTGLVDAVFCAHSHAYELGSYANGIPYIQGESRGEYVSRIQLSVDSNGKVTVTEQENIRYDRSWSNLLVVDEYVDNSNAQIADERNSVVARLDESLNQNPAIPRLVSRAIAEYALTQEEGKDIVLAMVNTARTYLPRGIVTYSDLYEAIPFDNTVYIARIKGSEIINQAQRNAMWRVSGEAINANQYYKVAIIDYLLYHQNSDRDYNYLPSAFTNSFTPIPLQKEGYDVYNYRNITRDYLLNNELDVNDYLVSNVNTDTKYLSQAVDLGAGLPPQTEIIHSGTMDDPYTVVEAIAVAEKYSSADSAPSCFVKGKVYVEYDNQYTSPRRHNTNDALGRIYLEDDEGNRLYVYWLQKYNGATYGSNWDWNGVSSSNELPNDLKVGDELLVCAYALFSYRGTPEIQDGFCLSINGQSTT